MCAADQSDLEPEARRRLDLAWRWLNDFPVNPHADLGREGPVCPYMGRALDREVVELSSFDARRGPAALEARARALREEFVARSDVSEHRTYLVYFIVPYGLPDPELRELVEVVHGRLRPDFVSQGMLAGDFWPDHGTRGLHSPTFRPFASPLPVLAMRNMVPGDLAFFAGPDVPAEEQLEYLGYYRSYFDGKLPEYWQHRLRAAEEQARQALATTG